MAFGDGGGDKAEIDSDFVNFAGLHQLGFEQGSAIASPQDAACDILCGALGMCVDEFDSTLSFGTVFIGEQRRACLFGGSTPQCLLAVSFAEANF